MLEHFDETDPPILIVHTTGDSRVPIVLADLVEDQCQAQQIPYEYYRIEGGSHCSFFNQTIDGLSFTGLLTRFLNDQVWEVLPPPGPVEPEPTMIAAKRLQLRDDPRDPPNPRRRRLNFLAKSVVKGVAPPWAPTPAGDSDPTMHGALLEVYRPDGAASDHITIDLPAAGWRPVGPQASRGYTYRLPSDIDGADVRVRLKDNLLRIEGKGEGMLTLAGAPQGGISLRFRLGAETQWCASTVAGRNDSAKQYRAQPQTLAAPNCPDRPYGSASQAFLEIPATLLD